MADVTSATPQRPLPWENAVVSSSETTQLPVFGAQRADLVVRESMDVVSHCEPDRVSKPAGRVLSPSQVRTFLTCSAKWWFKYGVGLPESKTSSLALGLAVHKTIEVNFREKLETHEDLETGGMVAVFRDFWMEQMADTQFREDEHPQALRKTAKNWSPSTWTKRPRRSSPPRWNSMLRARSEECRCAAGSTCWMSRGGLWT